MPHYFSEKQDSPLFLRKIQASAKGRSIGLLTGQGVFSKGHLDTGSLLLIESAEIREESAEVLDLGCGIGAVGIFIKILHPDTKVLMSDINERAVFLAGKNIALNNLEGISAIKSDAFANIEGRFDAILLNPPQTAGRALCYRMIEESALHLNVKGTLQLVARHNKGGRMLEGKMLSVFGNAASVSRSAGYRVYLSRLEPGQA